MEKLVLIDGNSLLNRAFYATPVFTTKTGTPTNGVFGFVKLLLKILSDKKPTYLAVAFDVKKPTFRHDLYGEYKAGRKPMPDDLAVQMPILKEVLSLMGVKICEAPGFEADDVIGTLAKKFGVQTYIYTGDRDAYQLVDESTNVCFTRKGVSDILELSEENFKDEVGLTPAQIIDLKALMGDKSDNIPGVAGIGEKTAHGLLEKYGCLQGIYAHIDEIGGSVQKKLIEGKDKAEFSYFLATIKTDSPIDVSLAQCVIKQPFPAALKNKFAELEFRSLLAMNIFDEDNSGSDGNVENVATGGEEADVSALIEPIVRVEILSTIEDSLAILKKNVGGAIGCHYGSDGFRFFIKDEGDGKRAVTEQVECFLPVKRGFGLLEEGFYDYQLLPVLKAVFEGKNKVILYNSKEVRHLLDGLGISFLAPFEDVSILKYLAEGLGNSDGLEFCINYHSLPEGAFAYGVYRLWEIYRERLNEAEKKLYSDVELPLSVVLFDMEKQGVCVDEGALNAFSKRYNAEIEQLKEDVYRLAGQRFNINSTQQLGKVLFENLRIGAGQKKTKNSRSYSTTAEELEKYKDEHEIVPLILRYRQVQKIHSTYIEGFKPLIVGGKVHTTYNQIRTETGRLSSANPNLQNIPVRTDEGKELRKLFIAERGNVLLDADYSQIELRLLAHFSGCKELIEAYRNGVDIHALTASQVFGVPLERVTVGMRREAKAVNFGIIYGISGFGLGKDLGVSTKRAQEYIDRYFENYSDVKKYMTENVERAKKDGYTTTLLGRRRVINELKSTNFNVRSFGERAAMNMPLQGTSADIIKIAMINVHKKLKEGGFAAKLVLQVHDELLIDCPQNEIDAVAEILKNEMENAVSLNVPLDVDVGVGESWFAAK